MPSMKYALEKGKPKRLEIFWKGSWQNAKVSLDGEEIGAFTDVEHLRAGQEFTLEDGSHLRVQLTGGKMFPLINILKNGQPLTTMGPEAADRLKMTGNLIFLIAFANLFGGVMGIWPHTTSQLLPSAAWYSVVTGLIFFVLGFFVKRKSTLALGIAVAIFVIGGVSVLIGYRNLSGLTWLGLAFRVLLLLGMIQGFGAIQALKQEQLETAGVEKDN